MYLQDIFDLISKKKLNSLSLISQNLFPLAKEAMSQVTLPCDKCKHDIFTKQLICNEIGHYFIVQLHLKEIFDYQGCRIQQAAINI